MLVLTIAATCGPQSFIASLSDVVSLDTLSRIAPSVDVEALQRWRRVAVPRLGTACCRAVQLVCQGVGGDKAVRVVCVCMLVEPAFDLT